jgi:hypothetical protein
MGRCPAWKEVGNMPHKSKWYHDLAVRLDHPGYLTATEIMWEEVREARAAANGPPGGNTVKVW